MTFELLYGRVIRLPLDILKESWLAIARSSKGNESYTLMQERLAKRTELAQTNIHHEQVQQTQWYDRNTCEYESRLGIECPYPVVR